jgi:hypothetical protein
MAAEPAASADAGPDVKGHVVEAVKSSFFPNADLVANVVRPPAEGV